MCGAWKAPDVLRVQENAAVSIVPFESQHETNDPRFL